MDGIKQKETGQDLVSWGTAGKQALIAFSLQGRSHRQTGTPLQDNHALRILPNGWSLAVVCDGVGSKPHSDEGSRIAANAFADFAVRFFGSYQDAESILNLLKCAAHHATGEMDREARKNGRSVHDYNTTLHAAVFANGMVDYFHSGDGGIIALKEDGTFDRLTEPQKDEEYVIPLLNGPSGWVTGTSGTRVQSVLLCTDGVYDKLSGPVLRKYGDGIDKGISTFFLNPWCFDDWDKPEHIAGQMKLVFSDEAEPNDFYQAVARGIAQGEEDKEEEASVFVRDWIYCDNTPLSALQGIQDDISVAVIQNTAERPARQPMDSLKGPDWVSIRQQVYGKLYG